MNEWISVKEKLPNEIDEYIVTNGEIVTTLEWNGECWFSDVYNSPVIQSSVLQWMPLPAPPND